LEFIKRCKKCGTKVICPTFKSRTTTKYCDKCRLLENKKNNRKSYWKNPEKYRKDRMDRYYKSRKKNEK